VKRYACVVIAFLALVSAAHGAERRVALVIGNSAYKYEPLANPGNDARAVAQALRESGFEVQELRNLNQAAMRRAIREFGDHIAKGGIGLFYYAGHGIQFKGRNYLIPVGNDVQREDEIADQSVDVGLVLEKMRSANNALNILILDACRNNPFGTLGTASAGLAPMDAPPRTIIAFSTAPGQVAADGTGDNSAYAKNLVTYMREPGVKLEDVFKRVRTAVRQDSAGRQVPWENTSLEADFYFKPPDRKALAAEQEERRKEQQTAIDRAVEAALKRREQDPRNRASIEHEISVRVAAERTAAERKAAERIAAVEKEAQAAIDRAMRGRQTAPSSAPVRVDGPATSPQRGAPGESTKIPFAAPAGSARGSLRTAIVPNIGDTWSYHFTQRDYANKKESNFRMTVEEITDTEIRLRSGGGNLNVYDRDGNPVRTQYKSGELSAWAPFIPRFNYPMEPGKAWTQKFVSKRPNLEIENDATVTVVGWENITVQAGTFNALKISYVSWYRRRDNNFTGRTAVNFWYVPEIKRWVKLDVLERGNNGVIYTDSTEELLSYNVK
jgi:uncharacterized caspase-like protein